MLMRTLGSPQRHGVTRRKRGHLKVAGVIYAILKIKKKTKIENKTDL